jgi:hypothetical protein
MLVVDYRTISTYSLAIGLVRLEIKVSEENPAHNLLAK